MDCDSRVASPPIGQDSKTTTPISKVHQTHIALKAIGAKTLDDFVREAQDKNTFNAGITHAHITTSSSALAYDSFAHDALDALELSPSRSASKRGRGSDDSGGEGERIAQTSGAQASSSSSSASPLALLPIPVSSKLGKKMAMSRTGSAKEAFQRVPGASAVSTLNEFAQSAGLASPEYSHKSSSG